MIQICIAYVEDREPVLVVYHDNKNVDPRAIIALAFGTIASGVSLEPVGEMHGGGIILPLPSLPVIDPEIVEQHADLARRLNALESDVQDFRDLRAVVDRIASKAR